MKKTLPAFVVALLLASCTHIISSNFPGTPRDKMPASWSGSYSMTLPGFLSMADPSSNSTVTITRDRLEWKQSDKVIVYSLSDSLRYTVVGKNAYISLHNSHDQYTVMMVKEVKEGLDLFSMTAEDELEADQLKPFFKDVREHQLDSGNNNTGIKLYEVTIDDARLDDYFKSGIPGSSPIKLRRIKN